MNLEFTEVGWEDFNYWMQTDKAIIKKIVEIIKSIKSTPTKGIGKPEALKYEFKGCWSRIINKEHRLVFKISGTKGKDQKYTI